MDEPLLDPPSGDQIEIDVFGPGYGEGIVVHLGDGRWLAVDSCLPRGASSPPALEYLRSIGVDPSQDLETVVASHWHDDHVKGLATVWREATSARFVCSQALDSDEFRALAERPVVPSTFSSGVEELKAIGEDVKVRRASGGPAITHAQAATLLWSSPTGPVKYVWALSPSHEDVARSLEHLASLLPTSGAARVPAVEPNDASVVLYLDTDAGGILLGADLEHIAASRARGWHAVIDDAVVPRTRSVVYKVAHHGARSSYCPEIWEHLLNADAVAVIAPFQRGSVELPTVEDLERLRGHTARVVMTSVTRVVASRLPRAVERTVALVTRTYRPIVAASGHIQIRSNDGEWIIRGTSPVREV